MKSIKKEVEKIKLDLKILEIPGDNYFWISKKDKGLSRELKEQGLREPLNSKYIYKTISDKDVVLDIGANLGYFTLLCKNAKKIVCIEPISSAIPIIKLNINETNIKNKCEVVNAAVGKNNGKLNFSINKKFNFSKVISAANKESIKVKSMSLKYLVKKYNANVLRMDVEGYEYEILMKNVPKKINKIALELHTEYLGRDKTKKLIEYLYKEGFQIKYFISDIPKKLHRFNRFLLLTKLNKLISTIKKDVSLDEGVKLIFNRGDKAIIKLYQKITKRDSCVHLILER